MDKPKRKDFFAQTFPLDVLENHGRYFYSLDEAIAWLKVSGGGVVKKRGSGFVFVPGLGKIRAWGVVKTIEPEEK